MQFRTTVATCGAAMLLACGLATGAFTPALGQVVINGASVGASYTVLSGGVTATQNELVGNTSNGTITQSQGTNNAGAYQVIIGQDESLGYVTGTYNLSGGTLLAAGEQLGLSSGEGNFNQTAGTNTVTSLSVIGQFGAEQTGSAGVYTLAGGTLNATTITVGSGLATDSGSFAFNGGTANFATLVLQTGGAVTASGNQVLDSAANFASGNNAYSVTQSGGTNSVTAGSLELGVTGTTLHIVGGGTSFAPNTGTYNLSGGSVAALAETIGLAGSGAVVQTGGTNTVSGTTGTVTRSDGSTQANGSLVLGAGAGGTGSYSLQAGTLSAGTEVVGSSGAGSVVQTGGSNTTNLLTLAPASGGSGSYALNGGTLSAVSVTVGAGGSFAFGGGSLATSNLTINGGTVSATGNEQVTSTGPSQFASWFQNGGSNTISSGTLSVGAIGTPSTSYQLNSGTLSALNETVVPGANTIAQQGGTNTVSALTVAGNGGGAGYQLNGGSLVAGSIGVVSGGSFAFAPNQSADFGTLTIGGSVSAGSNEVLDSAGQTHASYAVNQAGGTNVVSSGALELGVAGGNTGTYTLGGGSLSAEAEVIGLAGSGIFTQTGGTNTLVNLPSAPAVTLSTGDTAAAGTLTVGLKSGGTGTYNLQGGTLTGSVQVSQYGTFNLSGGSAGAVTNNGSFTEATGGTVASLSNNAGASVAGALTVTSTLANAATLTMAGGSVTTGGGLGNTGTLSGYGTIGGAGGLTNSGTLIQSGGNLVVAATGTNDNTGLIQLASGTTSALQVAAGATLANDGVIALNGGTLSGAGILNNTSGVIGGTGRISVATFRNTGTLTADAGLTSVTGLFFNPGVVEMTGTGALLSGSILNNAGTIEGAGRINNSIADQGGTIQALGGTLVLGGPVSTVAGTTMLTTAGTKILVSGGGMTANVGTISLAGGSFDNGGTALANNGTISGYGTFASGGLTNVRSLEVAGGTTTFNGSVTNAATGTITIDQASAVFNGAVTNNGTLKTVGGTASYVLTFTNNGTVISDPSTQTFSGDLVEGSTGVIQASHGDLYVLEGGFLNHSTQNLAWNTTGAAIEFAAGGASAQHSVVLAGSNLGATAAGYQNNFAWATLTIDAGQSLSLADGTGTGDAAFYVDSLDGALISGGDITDIIGNGLDIFYDPLATGNAYLDGLTYALEDGGSLIPDASAAPEPASLPLLLSGLAGLTWMVRRRGVASGRSRS